jgi:hypothetical protein
MLLKDKNKISYLIIIVLVIIILLQRSCTGSAISNSEPKISVKIDTVYKHITDTVTKTVKLKSIVYVKPDSPQYYPGETIDTCKQRFQNLLKEHIAKKVYSDTLKLDSLGTITIIDTVWINKLYGKRKYIQNIKIPTVTKTITITKTEEPKRQLYIGGNLFGNQNSLQFITPGILYKDRKDRIYQANVGVNFNGSLTYGVGTYWKINLNKK